MAHVVVIGAGVVGLYTSVLLAGDGHRVTVLDRDPVGSTRPEEVVEGAWHRPGVKQYGHTHVLMPGGARLLEGELPQAARRLLDAGGRRHSMLAGAWDRPETGPARAGDERYETIAARRPVLEAALYEAASATDGVTVRGGTRVRGLLFGESPIPGRAHVTGVVTDGGARTTADLVVDVSGRRTETASMLGSFDSTPGVLREETGFRYYTRYFRADDRGVPASRFWPLTHHDSVSVITGPGDGDTWSVTLVTSGRDQELRRLGHSAAWDRALSLYPDAAHWAHGTPTTDVRVMAGTGAVYRRWVIEGEPRVTGLVAIGDAYMTTNPQFSMGMTSGLGQAKLLREAIRFAGLRHVDLAVELDRRLEEVYWPLWLDTVAWDRHRIAELDAEMRGGGYRTDDPGWHVRTALDTAALLDPDVVRGYGQVACMLATADEALVKPGLLERARELAAGRPRYPHPGPGRQRLLAAVDRAA